MPRQTQREKQRRVCRVVEEVYAIVKIGCYEEVLSKTEIESRTQVEPQAGFIISIAVGRSHAKTCLEEQLLQQARPACRSVHGVDGKGRGDAAMLRVLVLPPVQYLPTKENSFVRGSTHAEICDRTALIANPPPTSSEAQPETFVSIVLLGACRRGTQHKNENQPNRRSLKHLARSTRGYVEAQPWYCVDETIAGSDF